MIYEVNELIQAIVCGLILAGTIGFGCSALMDRKEIKRIGFTKWFLNIK